MNYRCEATDKGKTCGKPASLVVVAGKLLETLASLCSDHINTLAKDGYSIREAHMGNDL